MDPGPPASGTGGPGASCREPPVLTFAGSYIDRCAELRQQPAALAAAWADPACRLLPVWQSLVPVAGGRLVLWPRSAPPAAALAPEAAVFLGRFQDQWLFAVGLPDSPEPPAGGLPGAFTGLRDLLGVLPAAEAAVVALARGLLTWQGRHRHCGVCGAPNQPLEGGHVMGCSRPGCGHRSFPRLDPAVIMLIHQGEACLLGRRPDWPAGRFSTLAGFVEPGESLEDAVRREVREETDVRVGACRYLASQPWPFPASLMIGFHGEAESTAIRLNDRELAEARWLTRAELAAGAVTLPPRQAVSWHLIARWFDAGWPVPLASLDLDRQM